MEKAQTTLPRASASDLRGWRAPFSRGMRRNIQHAARLADEMNVHSYRVHVDGTVTWVRWKPPAQSVAVAQKNNRVTTASSTDCDSSTRVSKRIERARTHHERMKKAAEFRCSHALRHALRHWSNASRQSGADAASQPPPRDAGDGVPASGSNARDSATPSMAHPRGGPAHLPQQQLVADGHTMRTIVPQVWPAGCGSPTTGGEGPAGVVCPQPMHVSTCACPRSGARNVAMSHAAPQPSPPAAFSSGLRGPPGAAPTAYAPQRDPNQYRVQLREQHYISFRQFHAQQGVPDHEACRLWDQYEQRHVNEYMGAG